MESWFVAHCATHLINYNDKACSFENNINVHIDNGSTFGQSSLLEKV